MTSTGHHVVYKTNYPLGSTLPVLLLVNCALQASAFYSSGARASCPDFRDYTALHWGITLGRDEPRYLVTQDIDGLADRVVNAVTAFYIALVTRRALCLLPADAKQPPLEVAFDAPFVDWACPGAYWKGAGSEFLHLTREDGDFHSPRAKLYRDFVLGDIRNLKGNNVTTWHIAIQRGLSVAIFHNLAHAPELRQLGLRPDTAFGCALAYLMRPNRKTLWLVPRPLLAVMTDESFMKIGLQLRTGDKVIRSGHNANASSGSISDATFTRIAEPFFRCAQALEDDLVRLTGVSRERVLWYLMTDSVAVRLRALERYGPAKLLVFNATKIELFTHVSAEGFRFLVMEHWLLQQAHYHIITERSGLGRTAAFASLRDNNVFTLNLQQNNFADDLQPGEGVSTRRMSGAVACMTMTGCGRSMRSGQG
eukprot:CAMPEP_0202891552 /NCGR_PEP_ID=MMETSP1392-20130828/1587_1 /ASSEMBLY_ACC=CAM_ASM_000868 /TAXON_ID=225041 /ORGANISM="Chlamydomonas chlamydogama, Strain SAG 11-48b" /LENGTH=422 /DNA_ID=CAMNT_0049575341 /DNA_START=251 /DNA_END=1520 /DNA_ORIENTATION=+